MINDKFYRAAKIKVPNIQDELDKNFNLSHKESDWDGYRHSWSNAFKESLNELQIMTDKSVRRIIIRDSKFSFCKWLNFVNNNK